jgi:integrase
MGFPDVLLFPWDFQKTTRNGVRKRERVMTELYKKGKPRHVDGAVGGRRGRSPLQAKKRAAAEAAPAAFESALAPGRSPTPRDDATGTEIAPDYVVYCEARDSARAVSLRNTNFLNLRRPVGDVPVRETKRADIEESVTARLPCGHGATINRELTTFRHFFNFAARRDLVDVDGNPCRGVKRLPERRRPIKILTAGELESYFYYCRKHDQLLYDLSAVAFGTGLRRGDILMLRGADCDGKRRTLTVQVCNRNGELTLDLPLNSWMFDVLYRRKSEHGDGCPLPGRKAPHFVDFKRRFARAKKATGVELRFGEFRHNCAIALPRAGVNVYVVKELLGHTSVNTTAGYLKLLAEELRAAVDKLDLELARSG